MIIAFREFRDEEYFIPRQIFESAGASVSTFSSSLGQAIGSQGGEARVDGILKNLKTDDFDIILFVGGSGALHEGAELRSTGCINATVRRGICLRVDGERIGPPLAGAAGTIETGHTARDGLVRLEDRIV